MDHPLRNDDFKALRRDFFDLVRNHFDIPRESNIIFVCGGNQASSVRDRFHGVFSEALPDYEFFKPELAMRAYWNLADSEQFDLTQFEEWIGQLSIAIIIFPESPGSIAETGYFSALPSISRKVLLVLDEGHMQADSFIMIGPAKKISGVSRFHPNIVFKYDDPDFTAVFNRIKERAPLKVTRKALKIVNFSETEIFDLFSIIEFTVDFLRIVTIEDIEFFIRGLYGSKISASRVKQVVSILIGTGRLVSVGGYGHWRVSGQKGLILRIKDGGNNRLLQLSLEVAVAIEASPEFSELIGD